MHTLLRGSPRHDVDQMMTVMREGGPFHCQGSLPAYIELLRRTSRSSHAALLAHKYGMANAGDTALAAHSKA
jgi:hypothetical protein